ncbi:hypothetical protein NL108_012006 [Boleophthalmus pectinirostris]|nr:hypothetical protein NL108_012006 [Boleophthalmus pectinirostris]
MTKTLPNSPQDGNRSRKRILKPVVEKKRRDRINHSLAELRSLLLNSTSDPVNAVQIRHTPVSPPRLEPSSVFTMETAGFKQCMAELTSYIHKITPAQRSSLIEGLKRHTDTHPPSLNHELEQRLGHVPSSLDSSYSSSDKKEDSLKFPFLSHSFNHSPHCSTPLHDYLSPPLSPWLSPLSGYSTSPPFVTYACHFTFPPTPPSCNSSLSTLPAPVPFTPTPGVYLPLQPPPRGACSSSASVWRPW